MKEQLLDELAKQVVYTFMPAELAKTKALIRLGAEQAEKQMAENALTTLIGGSKEAQQLSLLLKKHGDKDPLTVDFLIEAGFRPFTGSPHVYNLQIGDEEARIFLTRKKTEVRKAMIWNESTTPRTSYEGKATSIQHLIALCDVCGLTKIANKLEDALLTL